MRGEVQPTDLNRAFLISSDWVTCEQLTLLLLLSLEVNARAVECGAILSLVCECSCFTKCLLVELS